MSDTIKERAAKHALKNASMKERIAAERHVDRVRNDPDLRWLSVAISQTPRDDMPAHEVLIASRAMSWLLAGGGVIHLDLGHAPGPDRDVEENAAKLSTLGDLFLARRPSAAVRFSGRFWGGNYDADGDIGWESDVEFSANDPAAAHFVLGPRKAPLEVGYVRAWQVHFHLVRSGIVARWPYGDESITIFALRPDYWAERVALGSHLLRAKAEPAQKEIERRAVNSKVQTAMDLLREAGRPDLATEVERLAQGPRGRRRPK